MGERRAGRHARTNHGSMPKVLLALVALAVVLAPAAWFLRSSPTDKTADPPRLLEPQPNVTTPAGVGNLAVVAGSRGTASALPASTTSTTSTTSTSTSGAPTSSTSAPSTTTSGAPTSGTPSTTSPPSPSSTTPRPRPSSTSRPPAPAPGGSTSAVIQLTNAERAKRGCRPLQADANLGRAAQGHAQDMVNQQYFDHTGKDGSSPFVRMARAGYRGFPAGENIAAGQSSAAAVMKSWMKSPGHRANILNCSFNRIGVGYSSGSVGPGMSPGSWVQNFGIS